MKKRTVPKGPSKDESGTVPVNDAVPPADPPQPKRNKNQKRLGEARGIFSRFLTLAKFLVVIMIATPIINYAALKRESMQLLPEFGELYDIGWGQKLFMMCHGEGTPTVILDAPTGMSSDAWFLVWPEVAKKTRVCIYDRAGLGLSDRPFQNSTSPDDEEVASNYRNRWQSFTAERMVEDLRTLLTHSSNQAQPFILVGAELGALLAQFYTQMYDSTISAIVLINPLPDDLFEQDDGIWSQYWFGQLIPSFQTLQLGAAIGLSRLALIFGMIQHPLAEVGGLSDEVKNRQKHLLCHPKHLSSVVDEHHFINETFSQMRTVRLLRNIPSNISISVLTGNYYDEQMHSTLNKAWAKSERNLLSKHFPGSPAYCYKWR
ncbi:hypothetical protein ScPMuIL_009631 [Solemya velum]